ncbi:hypothetical protein EYW49_07795 [Siculibacillus lacustris]|uniref:Uncharacterized protein n=1 Tax=Siculibacillus lacustris TaxID=1549641 RepID=A0A4Q9VSR0_9HYPH|nr:hypothetical protein [Siculibacillus lacustris]TBW39024.1 hypothetical protein EYW49_07795 [Siculibacillus lacustris]
MSDVDLAPLAGIEARLRRHGAWFADRGLDLSRATARADATTAIAAHFPTFERVRDVATGCVAGPLAGPAEVALARQLVACGVLVVDGGGVFSPSAEADRYLRGGWLEEHLGLCALAAGADEVRIGQKLGWIAQGFEGENEIDTIARFADRLVFVSAKALRSRLDDGGPRHRARLMEALQEADNLIDHFGEATSAVALVVTTDLWDERRGEPRYEQLHGKAAALGVALVPLEWIDRERLVARLAELGAGRGRGR